MPTIVNFGLAESAYLVFLGKIVEDSRAVRDKHTQHH
jgi:hypothetical protein